MRKHRNDSQAPERRNFSWSRSVYDSFHCLTSTSSSPAHELSSLCVHPVFFYFSTLSVKHLFSWSKISQMNGTQECLNNIFHHEIPEGKFLLSFLELYALCDVPRVCEQLIFKGMTGVEVEWQDEKVREHLTNSRSSMCFQWWMIRQVIRVIIASFWQTMSNMQSVWARSSLNGALNHLRSSSSGRIVQPAGGDFEVKSELVYLWSEMTYFRSSNSVIELCTWGLRTFKTIE